MSHNYGHATHQSHSWFTRFAKVVSNTTGKPVALMLAVAVVLLWAILGPVFKFSDTWQLVINTSTTIITFLMVFLIQNTQNRDTAAIQIKLDELIRANVGAHNALLILEDLDDAELDSIRSDYVDLADDARKDLERILKHRRPAAAQPKRKRRATAH